MKPLFLLGVAVCLGTAGCDSDNPLSDPQTSKADERLAGIWREPHGDVDFYYHIGHAGARFPAGVMRVVRIRHDRGEVDNSEDYLMFPTVLGNQTYLNVAVGLDDKLVQSWIVEGEDGKGREKGRKEKDAKAREVEGYMFYKFKLDGDKLTFYAIDEEAKQNAIKDGKIKGIIEHDNLAKFTDTSKNLARFIADAGDSLWNTKMPVHLERVNVDKKL